ncbi:ABC transporter permease [Sphingobium sp. AN558]|uniref:ABC transporter permease n=1 Tax=Sphingobium sp. AN558 TaxID=3133442 RepID=UPI0030C09E0A
MKNVLRAALVIARRDFTAVIFSKTFILFLLGPLFPLVIGMAFNGLGQKITRDRIQPAVAVALPAAQADRMAWARQRIASRIGSGHVPELRPVPAGSDPRILLGRKDAGIIAVLSGSLDHPVLTGKAEDIDGLERDLSLMAGLAKVGDHLPHVAIARQVVADNASAQGQGRLATGRAAQVVIFILTMLLAGMVLSNLVEEKTNKVIEILAAAVPIDAVFLGKLMAMLAMSFVGILFWGSGALGALLLLAGPDVALPTPAVGWPLFLALGVIYFAMAYTLLGSLFLGIGAQAATVREVQTLNMPVTMGQMAIFFFATYAVDHMGSRPELAACIFPFSSPFAMIARAAQSEALWPHLVAIMWQAVWVGLIIRLGVHLFRRHVMNSGKSAKRGLFRRRTV